MASANTLRCLARPSVPTATRFQPLVRIASFSTTNTRLAAAPAAGDRRNLPAPQKKNYKKKGGGAAAAPAKKPNPGERKAFRKRIQLSNNSALVVQGTEPLQAKTMTESANAGKMCSIPDAVVDQLRDLEAFKPTQTWNLFRKPHTLVRKETVELVEAMEKATGNDASALRCVLTGSRLSGKSTAQIQAMSHALLNGWVVVHIPEAQDLTNGNTEFAPIPNTNPVQMTQPVYCQKLMQNILKANQSVLQSIKTQKDWSSIGHIAKGATLVDLIHSAKETDAMWPTLKALWTELTLPGRPPVYLGLDGLSHINKISDYRDPAFNQVHAHDLTLVAMFVDALSGKTKLPNGGAIIGSTSGNNFERHVSQELVLSQLETIAKLNADKEAGLLKDKAEEARRKQEIPQPDPYERNYDDRVYDSLKDTRVIRFEGVSKNEARSLMEYWGASGLFREALDSKAVAAKWALGGHGIIGEMERVSLMTLRV